MSFVNKKFETLKFEFEEIFICWRKKWKVKNYILKNTSENIHKGMSSVDENTETLKFEFEEIVW